MNIQEVSTKKHIKDFLKLPVRLYKDSPNWIQPLNKDIEAVFDRNQNKKFRHGDCTRWVLYNESGLCIGRVAAFYDKKTMNKDNDQPTGGMGFFECTDDQEAANLLFDTCKAWLEGHDMEAMDGPVNFGERERWWGLLAEGDYEPNYCMPYTHFYYKELFENYGFKLYFKQLTYYTPVRDRLQPKVREKAERVLSNPEFEFRHMNVKEIDKYTEDFRTIYNKAWARHGGVSEMPLRQAKAIMKSLKPILDPKIVWFGYHKGKPIAFFIMIPEMNQIFKHMNGKFGLFEKLKFVWYHKLLKSCKKIFGVVFGVIPEFQGRGVEAAIVIAFSKLALRSDFHYEHLEFNWIGDFNPKMMKVAVAVGGEARKVHHTYRKLFDETKEFERMKIIGGR